MTFERFAKVISRIAAGKERVKMRNTGIDQSARSVKRSPDSSTLRYHGLVCAFLGIFIRYFHEIVSPN